MVGLANILSCAHDVCKHTDPRTATIPMDPSPNDSAECGRPPRGRVSWRLDGAGEGVGELLAR